MRGACWRVVAAVALLVVAASGHGSVVPKVAAAAREGTCDIYARGKTPCVAAHSMTRALYRDYTGPLYCLAKTDGCEAGRRHA